MIAPLHPAEPRFAGGLTELGPGVHGWLQPNGLLGESNAGLVIGDGASLLVDTLWDRRLTRLMLAAFAPLVKNAPISTVVNTHSDGDHWWGNQELEGAEIVATDAAAAVMRGQSPAEMRRFGALAAALRGAASLPIPRRDDVATIAAYVTEALAPFEFRNVRLVPPTRTFSGELTLEVGGREVQLIEVGPAHTVGDLIVWVPDARIAIAADILFIGVTPIMWAGPVERWIAALERLLDLGAERFLPGHGPVCGAEEVNALLDYWRQARSATTRELAGLSPWLAPERALVNVANINGTSGPPGPRQLVSAFFRMALLARDLR